jgi:hypothetical protein
MKVGHGIGKFGKCRWIELRVLTSINFSSGQSLYVGENDCHDHWTSLCESLGISTGKPAGVQTSTRTRTRDIPVPVYPRVLAGMGLHAGLSGLGGYGTREGSKPTGIHTNLATRHA